MLSQFEGSPIQVEIKNRDECEDCFPEDVTTCTKKLEFNLSLKARAHCTVKCSESRSLIKRNKYETDEDRLFLLKVHRRMMATYTGDHVRRGGLGHLSF